MEFLIVTGLSGAGKSLAVNALEDIGFFCIDNIPPALIPKIVEFVNQGESMLKSIAVVIDVRAVQSAREVQDALHNLDNLGEKFRILFLDADDSVLQHRYKESRRRHPISLMQGVSTAEAIRKEREILEPFRAKADFMVDTSFLSVAENRRVITGFFTENVKETMTVTVLSFGFKYGLPKEADIVYDVRCLPNPFYIPELKEKTGLDADVQNYVLSSEDSGKMLNAIKNYLDITLPLYVKEGKSELVIAFGCTGGQHRSVTFAELISKYCRQKGFRTELRHRDALRNGGKM